MDHHGWAQGKNFLYKASQIAGKCSFRLVFASTVFYKSCSTDLLSRISKSVLTER